MHVMENPIELHFFLQISEAPFLRPGQMMQIRNDPLVQKSMRYKDFHQEEKRAVMITWCFGGKRVAITGSWDNWKTMYWNLYYGVYVWSFIL